MQTTVSLAPTVAIHSDQFDLAKTRQSVLCMEVGHDRFRFLVQNAGRRGCYFEDYTFPSLLTERPLTNVLPDVFREHPVLSAGLHANGVAQDRTWQEIRIAVNSSSFTLIPKPLFRKEYAGSYLGLMRGNTLPGHEFAQSYAHEAEGFLSVFNLEHPLADYFSEVYPLQPLTFVHQSSSLLQATANLDRHSLSRQNVWLYFDNEFVTIIHRADHQLRYCNRFGFKNAQDLAYYILYILDELKLVPDATTVSLYGEITPFADTYAELARFLPNLSFGQTPPGVSLTEEFDEVPEHRYLSLFGLCLLS